MLEQPLADDGDTGAFLRWGWDDGKEESFAFTEVDEVVSSGVQLSGSHWPSSRSPGGWQWPVRVFRMPRTASIWPPAAAAFCSVMGL